MMKISLEEYQRKKREKSLHKDPKGGSPAQGQMTVDFPEKETCYAGL